MAATKKSDCTGGAAKASTPVSAVVTAQMISDDCENHGTNFPLFGGAGGGTAAPVALMMKSVRKPVCARTDTRPTEMVATNLTKSIIFTSFAAAGVRIRPGLKNTGRKLVSSTFAGSKKSTNRAASSSFIDTNVPKKMNIPTSGGGNCEIPSRLFITNLSTMLKAMMTPRDGTAAST